jgi:hypothetical protein
MDKGQRALELRIAGWKVSEIAPQIGYSDTSTVYKVIRDALLLTLSPLVEEYRALINERYEVIVTVLWPKVLEGDYMAIDRVCKILKDQAGLHGLLLPKANENNANKGTIIWAPLTQEQEDRMRGRIALTGDKPSSIIPTPATESSLVVQDGVKT